MDVVTACVFAGSQALDRERRNGTCGCFEIGKRDIIQLKLSSWLDGSELGLSGANETHCDRAVSLLALVGSRCYNACQEFCNNRSRKLRQR